MLIDEKHLDKALSDWADCAMQKAKMQRAIQAMIENLQAGSFRIVICDDGAERDVTAENIENLKNALA
jgi:hypothetical protein